jgi:hypothetical protein
MPAGLESTVPLPAPLFVTVTAYVTGVAAAAQASLEYADSPAVLNALTR